MRGFLRLVAMETNNKELYEAPLTTVVDLKFEGIICQSNGLNQMDDPEDL